MPSSFLTIKQILVGYKDKEFTSKEIFDLFYSRIKEYDPTVKAFISLVERKDFGIEGNFIPIAHKDIFSTKNIQTTAGSAILKNYTPPYDATVVERLNKANFVCVGKVNCDAFAHGTTGENSDFFVTKNPYNLERTPGGSSSGSSASVAAGLVPIASATDTGGSIRLPASFTNTVGIKPTYGRVSRYGVIAMTSSTDSIGHITKTVWDSAYILNITAGYDPRDATSSHIKVDDYLGDIGKDISGLKIGIPREYVKGLSSRVRSHFERSVKIFEKLGAKIVEISLPHTEYALNAYYIITPCEISSNLARFDGIRFGNTRDFFGEEAKRRIMMGTYGLSAGYYDAYYLKAQKVRTLVVNDFRKAFEQVDVLVAPVFPDVPPKIGEVVDDPIKMYLMDILTVPVNLAGIPALAVPGGFFEGTSLPLGIQIMGNHFEEKLLYRVGYAFEQETKYYEREPKLLNC